ncbi:MAG: two-component system response regulator, partial [Gammaproteobacteria bacterium]|nr:two-component system response regulator [Gammaproteobacteria bacterium]
ASNISQQIQNVFKLPESGISLDALEKSLFSQALNIANGNQTQASRLLGISRDTFLYRLKKYGI